MKRIFASLILVGLLSMTMLGVAAAASNPAVIYDSTPQPLPPNVVSQGFQATSTDEFGDYIAFVPGPDRELSSVTVTMSAWGEAIGISGNDQPSGLATSDHAQPL